MKIDVLDHGYVALKDHMGSDLSVVNAARVSHQKESYKFENRDEKLLAFLAKEGHTSPFRHAFLTLEVYAPLLVARQWWKYVVGSDHQDKFAAWNESSRRYITEDVVFYMPGTWRHAPESLKQGSGHAFKEEENSELRNLLESHQARGLELYEWALEQDVAPEQARLFLPAYGMYVRWVWTCSLQGILWFLQQRMQSDAQKEINEYARAVLEINKVKFPVSTKHWIYKGEVFELDYAEE